jgi:2-polyprenyl-6-methoxyphenol hydroxylase-like FAD-dependent oxidoreductase
MSYYDQEDNILISADFNGLIGKTRFPYYLLLPQNITEDTLRIKLKEVGIPFFNSHKVVDMRENPNDCNAVDVSFENGQSITTQYVVGADGNQSIVRPIIPFGILVRR